MLLFLMADFLLNFMGQFLAAHDLFQNSLIRLYESFVQTQSQPEVRWPSPGQSQRFPAAPLGLIDLTPLNY